MRVLWTSVYVRVLSQVKLSAIQALRFHESSPTVTTATVWPAHVSPDYFSVIVLVIVVLFDDILFPFPPSQHVMCNTCIRLFAYAITHTNADIMFSILYSI